MYSFVSGSFVHNEWLNIQKEEYPNEKPIELHRLSDTRWSSHVVACNAVSKRFSTFIDLLDRLSNNENRDRACEAIALHSLIDIQFVFLLRIFSDILDVTINVSDKLQSGKMELTTARDLISEAQTSLRNMRNEQKCNMYTDSAKKLCDQNDIWNEASNPTKRKRKVPSYMSEYHVTEPSGLSESQEGDTYALLRQNIYFPILDKYILSYIR